MHRKNNPNWKNSPDPVTSNGRKDNVVSIRSAAKQPPPSAKAPDLNSLDGYHCQHCGMDQYLPVFILRRLPGLYSQSAKDELIQAMVAYQCVNCGWQGTLKEMKLVPQADAGGTTSVSSNDQESAENKQDLASKRVYTSQKCIKCQTEIYQYEGDDHYHCLCGTDQYQLSE